MSILYFHVWGFQSFKNDSRATISSGSWIFSVVKERPAPLCRFMFMRPTESCLLTFGGFKTMRRKNNSEHQWFKIKGN